MLDHKNKLLSKLNPKVVKFLRNSLAFIIRILRKLLSQALIRCHCTTWWFSERLNWGKANFKSIIYLFRFFLALFPVIIVFYSYSIYSYYRISGRIVTFSWGCYSFNIVDTCFWNPWRHHCSASFRIIVARFFYSRFSFPQMGGKLNYRRVQLIISYNWKKDRI